ncbi:hypothetical protein NITHO_6180002 [Nitrolancea hollandica Lb]|uniref:Uncharacterized protein n=1 Tax=Nitrolancea hollandica Lb TaxID=1129897 RepID=I4EML3_9BACT|nr:hypothetical protein NITHO_6180002 [Nitrolancea hollandica Lb]
MEPGAGAGGEQHGHRQHHFRVRGAIERDHDRPVPECFRIPLLGTDQEHRFGTLLENLLRNRAEEEAPHAARSMRREQDQIGLELVRMLGDAARDIMLLIRMHVDLHRHPVPRVLVRYPAEILRRLGRIMQVRLTMHGPGSTMLNDVEEGNGASTGGRKRESGWKHRFGQAGPIKRDEQMIEFLDHTPPPAKVWTSK